MSRKCHECSNVLVGERQHATICTPCSRKLDAVTRHEHEATAASLAVFDAMSAKIREAAGCPSRG